MLDRTKKIPAKFFQTHSGKEPVREWIRSLRAEDRKIVGVDIQKVEFGLPLRLPYCRALGDGLWEIRSRLTDAAEARVIFGFAGGEMVLLHGFIKKTRKTPLKHLALARRRMKELQ